MNRTVSIIIMAFCFFAIGYCIRYLQACCSEEQKEKTLPEPKPEPEVKKKQAFNKRAIEPPEHHKGEPAQTHELELPRTIIYEYTRTTDKGKDKGRGRQ